jgi:DNA-binding PadR family transcriptional regulator
MNKRLMMPSPREAAFLDILTNGKRYGREIRDEYRERTGQGVSLAAVYVTLARMERSDLIVPSMGESTPDRGGHRRRYYEITGLGERLLRSFEEYVSSATGGRLRWISW